MKIKAIFPGNFYSRRKIKIIDENKKVIDYLSPNQIIEINNPPKKLTFKLDYHKQSINVENNNQNLIVFFKFRPYFPFNYIDLFKNAMIVKKVNGDFDKTLNNILNKHADKKISVNAYVYASLFIQVIAAFSIILFSILKPKMFNDLNNLIFIIGLISLVSITIWWFSLQNTYENEYKTRVISAIFLFAGLSIVTKGILSIILLISSLSLLLLFIIAPQKLIK